MVTDFLLKLGLAKDFGNYCGKLDRELYDVFKEVIDAKDKGEPGFHLQTYLRRLRGNGQFEKAALQKARVATVVNLA